MKWSLAIFIFGHLSQIVLSYLKVHSDFRITSNLQVKKKDTEIVTTSDSNPTIKKNPAENDLKKEALAGVLYQIERSYGKGSIQKLGENTNMMIETTSSGAVTLDMALGGGYPKGRVIEIYGPESSGKTTLALHAIAEIQKADGQAAFIDAEHALDPEYARHLGVDVDNLLICQPDSGEMALDVVDQLIRSSAVDIIVVDSVAALVPRAELEGDMGDTQMGLQARLMSKAMRKITGSLGRSKTTVIFINQLRSKIGVMYGSPEVTAGGNALKFYASVRIDVRRKEPLKDNQGIKVRVKVVKNKISPPFKVVEFDILFGSGIDRLGCLVDAAELCGVIQRRGSWYFKDDLKLAQGRYGAIDALKSGGDSMILELEQKVKSSITNKDMILTLSPPTASSPMSASPSSGLTVKNSSMSRSSSSNQKGGYDDDDDDDDDGSSNHDIDFDLPLD